MICSDDKHDYKIISFEYQQKKQLSTDRIYKSTIVFKTCNACDHQVHVTYGGHLTEEQVIQVSSQRS